MVLDGGIDSDRKEAFAVLCGGGALGNGRMHGIPQMLECYLQLAGRAGPRQRPDVSIGVACHSSPHYGGRGGLQRGALLMSEHSKSSPHIEETGTEPATVDRVTWAERAAERSPVVQRSRDRGVEQAKSIVAAARRLVESKGPSFTTQELIKEAGIALTDVLPVLPG